MPKVVLSINLKEFMPASLICPCRILFGIVTTFHILLKIHWKYRYCRLWLVWWENRARFQYEHLKAQLLYHQV